MSIRSVSSPVPGPAKHNVVRNHIASDNTNVSFNHLFRQVSSAVESLDQELLASQIDLVMETRDMHSAVLAAEEAQPCPGSCYCCKKQGIEAYQEIMRMPL